MDAFTHAHIHQCHCIVLFKYSFPGHGLHYFKGCEFDAEI